MTGDIFIERLSWFKANERPEAVLFIADDSDRIRLILAWTNMRIEHRERLIGLKNESESEVWDWLWQNAKFSKTELKEKCGAASEISLDGKMKLLIGNRIIYPDGTVNSYVQRYLRQRVVALFENKPSRAKKPAS